MTDWYDMLKSPLFDESSKPAYSTKILKPVEESLNADDERNHGYTPSFESSWEDFCLYDSTEHAIEIPNPTSLACSLAQSPARDPPPYTNNPQYNTFNPEQSWELFSNGTSMDLAVVLAGKQSTGSEEIGGELASWFGNPTNVPRSSAPAPVPTFKAQRQGSPGGVIADDTTSDSGTFGKPSPSAVAPNRSRSFTWSSPRSTSSASSIEGSENELRVQNDFQAAPASRRGRRKFSATCPHSKHYAQVERTRAANRAAAHRYREKRRAATDALQSRVRELEAEKQSLNATIGTLHAALLSLRKKVSRHGACGGDRIV
jgi:hypothetical protein